MPKKVAFEPSTKIEVTNVVGFLKRQVTAYGTGAKVTCPKEYLGKTVYLIITDEPSQIQTETTPKEPTRK
jgi:putative transposon-encoded protein